MKYGRDLGIKWIHEQENGIQRDNGGNFVYRSYYILFTNIFTVVCICKYNV